MYFQIIGLVFHHSGQIPYFFFRIFVRGATPYVHIHSVNYISAFELLLHGHVRAESGSRNTSLLHRNEMIQSESSD